MNKRDCSIKAALTAAGLAVVSTATANNINVSNVTLQSINTTAGTAIVQFDLSWENSWRLTNGPANHDAAWVFVKFHVADNAWKTASLDINEAVHSTPAGATLDMGLTGAKGVGCFIYRATSGSGNNNFNGVRLRWDYAADGVSNSALVSLDVHAIEMVYVPQGSFQLGDGVIRNNTNKDTGTLCDGFKTPGSVFTTAPPFTVSGPGPISVGPVAGSLAVNGLPAGEYAAVPVTYPNGFSAFYTMKYEASQHQWAAFLNTTSLFPSNTHTYTYFDVTSNTAQAPIDVPEPIRARQQFTSADIPPPRPTPYFLPTTNDVPPVPTRPMVTALTPDRAFITTNNTVLGVPPPFPPVDTEALALVYLDWAGLRPMSEFEYEKVCRGPVAPLAGEFAWGTADAPLLPYGAPVNWSQGLADDGTPNERPLVNYNESGGNAWTRTTVLKYPAGGSVLGPCRVGMFAKSSYSGPTPPRIQSGAGYYGVMDLTGNTAELVVRWSFGLATVPVIAFTAEHGDGALAATGLHNVAGWPAAGAYALRGGSFEEVAQPVSQRATLNGGVVRNPGIRGLRTAPSP